MNKKSKILNLLCCLGTCMFMLQATLFGQNLIPNGDLQAGNPFTNGIAKTDFQAGCLPSYKMEGFYCYGDTMSDKFQFPIDVLDHTLGTSNGKMLIFDGFLQDNQKIWEITIPLQATTSYDFEFWGHNRYRDGSVNVQIDLYVNGSHKKTFTILTVLGWQKFTHKLSGYNGNTNIVLELKFGGEFKDFALDDFSLENDDPCHLLNEDFQAGDPFILGTATTDFQLSCGSKEGRYCYSYDMGTKYQFPHFQYDHTFDNPNGRMLIYDGFLDRPGYIIWKQDNINMNSTTDYVFTFWGHNRDLNIGGSDVLIYLYVNSNPEGSFVISASPDWQSFSKALTGYGPNSSIYLVQGKKGQTQDFAIDDISLCKGFIEEAKLASSITNYQEEISNQLQLQLQPNPAGNVVYIGIGDDFKALDVQVMDLSGKVVLANRMVEGSKLQLDVSGLKAGMYLVRATNGNYTATKKLIKK